MEKIKAAIIGSTGYAGEELVRILSLHKYVQLEFLTSKTYSNQNFQDVYSNFNKVFNINLIEDDIDALADKVDVIFLALPHGIASNKITKEILNKTKVIDLGADFRLKDKNVYEKWYNVHHGAQNLLSEAIYGLSEIYLDKIKKANLIANPGCYTTCSILSLFPLFKNALVNPDFVIIDAKSGVTGAGRGVSLGVHYCEVNENIKAYKIASHRHTPEIEQELSFALNKNVTVQFTPHLVPMNRGILTTSYLKLQEGVNFEDVKEAYLKQYKNNKFVRLLKENIHPETKWVKGSNYIDIALFFDRRTNNLIVQGAIDNLFKGASGQAVQNMNLMFGFDEDEGLKGAGIFPV